MVLVTESKVSHVGIAKQASRSPVFARELHRHASLLKTRLPVQIWLLTQTPACRIWCHGCNMQIHTDYRNPVEKKGWHDHSQSEGEGERARESPTPAWTGFYFFSGYIAWRMVLIYYAQVHCRWLPFTDNKGKNVANYFKEKDVADQREKWLNWLHSILGRFSTDFRKLKILSKHLLPQGDGVLARASLIAV